MKQSLQSAPLGAQAGEGAADLTRKPQYLLLDDVVAELRFDATNPRAPREAAWKFLRRWSVPVLRRGRTILVDRDVLNAVLREI